MKNSAINWTTHTANFWWGCQKVSDGCKNCYAQSLSARYGKHLWGDPSNTDREKKIGIWKDLLKWDNEARFEGIRNRVFVSSMSDFLEDHPQVTELRYEAMRMIGGLKNLDVLILTKRPENRHLLTIWEKHEYPDHVWMGTTVENQKVADTRIPLLVSYPVKVHFVSVEPMLERIDLDISGRNYGRDFEKYSERLQWIICGGESGPGCRPFDWQWAQDLRDQCQDTHTAFWMKQGGGHPNKRHKFSDIPEDLRIRELPNG